MSRSYISSPPKRLHGVLWNSFSLVASFFTLNVKVRKREKEQNKKERERNEDQKKSRLLRSSEKKERK
jgi:hypothetical protein